VLNPNRLDPDRSVLLVVDLQQKLLPLIHDAGELSQAARLLIRGAALFDLPVIVTEQYPKGIGPTDSTFADDLASAGATTLEKSTFSACGQEEVRERLRATGADQVILCGIETHVCVQQTVGDLLLMDYQVCVCADAVGSRRKLDHKTALHRMRHDSAAVTTVESVLFDLCNRCDTPKFKTMIEMIKNHDAPR